MQFNKDQKVFTKRGVGKVIYAEENYIDVIVNGNEYSYFAPFEGKVWLPKPDVDNESRILNIFDGLEGHKAKSFMNYIKTKAFESAIIIAQRNGDSNAPLSVNENWENMSNKLKIEVLKVFFENDLEFYTSETNIHQFKNVVGQKWDSILAVNASNQAFFNKYGSKK